MAKALFLEDLPIIGKYVRDLLANKVDKVEGKSLSTNDYTTEEKTKLEGLSIATITTPCSCSATDHDNVGTFTASFSYADIKAKGIDIDNTNNGFNILKYIFWKEQTVDGKTYKLSFPDGMETFKIENISMSYNFDGEKISSIDFEGIYKPQKSIETPTNYMNLDIILVNR